MSKQTLILPKDGLKPHTWYIVNVSFSAGNPKHKALFYTGFLNGKNNMPGGYSGFQALNSAHDEDRYTLGNARFVNFLDEIANEKGAIKPPEIKPKGKKELLLESIDDLKKFADQLTLGGDESDYAMRSAGVGMNENLDMVKETVEEYLKV